jgi:hypothetical protein
VVSTTAVLVVSNDWDVNAEDAFGLHGPALAPREKPNASTKALSDLGGAMFLVVREKRKKLGEKR